MEWRMHKFSASTATHTAFHVRIDMWQVSESEHIKYVKLDILRFHGYHIRLTSYGNYWKSVKTVQQPYDGIVSITNFCFYPEIVLNTAIWVSLWSSNIHIISMHAAAHSSFVSIFRMNFNCLLRSHVLFFVFFLGELFLSYFPMCFTIQQIDAQRNKSRYEAK